MPELRSRRFLLSAVLFAAFTFQPIAAGSAAATTAPIGSSAAPASTPAAAVEGELAGQLADALRRARYNNIAPGMAMSVIGPDGQTWSGSSGWFPEGVPVKADSPMRIGSVTKTFTAAIILGLVDEGRIELDVPASTYCPRCASCAAPPFGSCSVTRAASRTCMDRCAPGSRVIPART